MSSQNTDKLRSELFEQGLQNRREVVGEAYVEKAMQNGSSEFAYAQQELITEYDTTSTAMHLKISFPADSNHAQMGLGKHLVASGPRAQATEPPQ